MTNPDPKKGDAAYDFLWEKQSETQPHRAYRIDQLLDQQEARKAQRKLLTYVLGALAALAAAITNYEKVATWLFG